MDIRALNLFLHLASTLHFGQTSRACNITRSGLTRTIQRLEQELGEKLFLRDNRSVSLTSAGRLFREYGEDVVQRYRILLTRISRERNLRGELSIYCSVTAVLSILPAIITKFRGVHPDIHLNLLTGDAAMAMDRLESGEADITIAALPDRLPQHVVFLKMLETPLLFIAPRHQEKPAADTWSMPVIMPERGLSRVRCERWFQEKQITPAISSYVAGNEALIAMVAMGCGIGVVPRIVLDHSPLQSRVRVLEVRPHLKGFTVGACTTGKGRRNPLVMAFWHIAEQESTTIVEQGTDEDHFDNQ